jgi:DNA-binding NtrC family response regulator
MSGMEVIKHIKAMGIDSDIIIITAYASVDTAIEALRVGVYDYIKKPFSINQLRDKVKQCIDGRREKERIKDNRDMISLYEIIKACRVSQTTVNNWIQQGLIPTENLAERVMSVKKDDFSRFLKLYNLEHLYTGENLAKN